jgi:hypothetical protein
MADEVVGADTDPLGSALGDSIGVIELRNKACLSDPDIGCHFGKGKLQSEHSNTIQ